MERIGCDFVKVDPPDCNANFQLAYKQTWQGFCQFDGLTCSVTNNTFESLGLFNGGCTPGAINATPTGPVDCNISFNTFPFAEASRNTTQVTYNIYLDFYATLTTSRQEYGRESYITLSDEDTEDDAINRLLSGPAGNWGNWTGCPVMPPFCCIVRYEERVDDFDFDYLEGEWRIIQPGLTPGKSYSIEVEYWRSAYGAGMYALFQTVTYAASADGNGVAEFGATIPNEVGFETFVICHNEDE